MHPSGLMKEGCFKALSLVKLQPSFTSNLCSTLTDSDIAVHSSFDCKGLCHCYTFSAYYANLFYIHYKYTFFFGSARKYNLYFDATVLEEARKHENRLTKSLMATP